MGGQKGDNLEKTNDSRMPILCKHAFANQTYGFNLVGPQITSAASGASVRTTGSGSFDPVAQTKPATLSSPGGAFWKKLF